MLEGRWCLCVRLGAAGDRRISAIAKTRNHDFQWESAYYGFMIRLSRGVNGGSRCSVGSGSALCIFNDGIDGRALLNKTTWESAQFKRWHSELYQKSNFSGLIYVRIPVARYLFSRIKVSRAMNTWLMVVKARVFPSGFASPLITFASASTN